MSVDDDSDGEADRRQARMFKQHEIIEPGKDNLRKGHLRARSLPPPIHLRVDTLPESEGVTGEDREDEDIAVESSLDRKPSYLRRVHGGAISPDPSVRIIVYVIIILSIREGPINLQSI